MTTYTQQQLIDAFDEVKDKKNWKNGVSRLMFKPGSGKKDLIETAVAHYTGSETIWTPATGGKVRIEFAGYYQSIGS